MVAEDTKEILEEAVEIAEDTVALLERRVSWLTSNPKMVLLSACTLALAAGGAVGWLVATKKLRSKYQAEADEQIADVKSRYSILRKPELDEIAEAYESDISAPEADAIQEIVAKNGYVSYDRVRPSDEAIVAERVAIQTVEKVPEVVVPVDVNVFVEAQTDGVWDQEAEERQREENPGVPFIISKDEFFEHETDYTEVQLTYFDGDGILVDEQSSPIPNVETVVGVSNMSRFGHGSEDANIVYIRNPKLESDIEVIYSDGTFTKQVLGYDDGEGELQHSQRRPRKMRSYDE